jgi:UTP--glucose-1-phosphate uridylyltransferase
MTEQTTSITNAVVPVAGLGTRLLPATKSQPKEMLPVGRKPVVQYVAEELQRAGVSRVCFITGRNKSSIEDHFDHDEELKRTLVATEKPDLLAELAYEDRRMHYLYTRQRHRHGLGDAILHGEPFTAGQPFVVALGDCIIGIHGTSTILERLAACFHETGAACVVALEEVPEERVSRYGIVKPAGDGEVFPLADLVEKPAPAEAPSRLAIAARYVFAPVIFDALRDTAPDANGEVQLTNAMRLLLERGHAVYGVRLRPDEGRHDVGNFESYFKSFVDFMLHDARLGETMRRYMAERTKA